MYQSDFAAFSKLIHDLAVAFNRPLTDDLVRVFWEALKSHQLPRIRAKCVAYQATGKKFPSPADLVPPFEQKTSGAKEETVAERMKAWVVRHHGHEFSRGQLTMPWTWLHRGNARTGEGFEITGVVVPADGEYYARDFRVEDMEVGNAA